MSPLIGNKNRLSIINTKARSLGPKLESLIDVMNEIDSRIAVITETWFQDGEKLENEKQDLKLGSSLAMITKNRRPLNNGVAYGGVVVIWRDTSYDFKEFHVQGVSSFKILACATSVPGYTRKLVMIACYIPQSYNKKCGNEAMEAVADAVEEAKRRFKDPFVLVTGDFNQWRVDEALDNFADIGEVAVGNTRGNRSIDRVFCNMRRSVIEAGTLERLETEETADQDAR